MAQISTIDQELVKQLLKENNFADFLSLKIVPLAGDGSPRQFFRLFSKDSNNSLILVLPAKADSKELSESRSAWFIGKHLYQCEVPVPKPYAWHEPSGMLLFEDLGDNRLQDFVSSRKCSDLYREVVISLAHMQCKCISGFNETWCWDSPEYDKQLMLERESGYFLSAFWQGLLKQQIPEHLDEEFEQLAAELSTVSTDYFLHRDFQSRNIMVKDGKPRFIDFQGGRKGPIGYDIASLVNDPYAGLGIELRQTLIDLYFKELQKYTTLRREEFDKQYTLLACQRNLQIIGAFSYLSSICKKPFFAAFIAPAVQNLLILTNSNYFKDFKVLRNTVQKASTLLD